jgi:hypothetical protein
LCLQFRGSGSLIFLNIKRRRKKNEKVVFLHNYSIS